MINLEELIKYEEELVTLTSRDLNESADNIYIDKESILHDLEMHRSLLYYLEEYQALRGYMIPKRVRVTKGKYTWDECGNCHHAVRMKDFYCPKCSQFLGIPRDYQEIIREI